LHSGKVTNEIVVKKELAPSIKLMVVYTPLVARKFKPGQFVIVRVCEEGERIPLTIADADNDNITIVFQEVGKTTKMLGRLNVGDRILNLLGPLGRPTHIENYGHVCCVGGGVGVAALYPIAKALKEAGNRVTSIIGARTKDLIIFEDEMRRVSDELYITTDDGSKGERGFVTDVLKRLLEKNIFDRVFAIGPAIMMKVVSDVTKTKNIKTIVSLNPIMIDGTGMCGGCRVIVGGETKFACVDGPDFDGHLVDFNHLLLRLKMYEKQEKEVMQAA
jgi:ferredoxin--NADP+ reductase